MAEQPRAGLLAGCSWLGMHIAVESGHYAMRQLALHLSCKRKQATGSSHRALACIGCLVQQRQELCNRQGQLPQVVCVDAPAAVQVRPGQQLQRQTARQQVCAQLVHSVVSVQVFISSPRPRQHAVAQPQGATCGRCLTGAQTGLRSEMLRLAIMELPLALTAAPDTPALSICL